MVLWVSLQCVILVFPNHAHLLLHVNCEAGNDIFVYKYSKGLDVPVCASAHSHQKLLGAQWLSGKVHISRLTNCGFEPHLRHCVLSLSKSH